MMSVMTKEDTTFKVAAQRALEEVLKVKVEMKKIRQTGQVNMTSGMEDDEAKKAKWMKTTDYVCWLNEDEALSVSPPHEFEMSIWVSPESLFRGSQAGHMQ